MRWSTVVGVVLLVTLCVGCQALDFLAIGKAKPYEGSLLELFRDIRNRHQSIRNCQLEYEVKATEEGQTRVRRGTAWMQGTALRLDEEIIYETVGGDSHEVRVSTGSEDWIYRVDDGVASRQPLSPQTQEGVAERVARLGPLALIVEIPVPGPNMQVSEVRTTVGKQIRIELVLGTPGSGEPWLRRTAWVGAKDLLVSRTELEGARQERGRVVQFQRVHRYWNYELDRELEADLFLFVPPMGTRIEQLPPR